MAIKDRKQGEFLGVIDTLGLSRPRKMKWKVVNPSTLRNRMKKMGIVYGCQSGAIKSAVFSIIRCIIAYLSVRVVSLKEKPKVIIRVCRPFI
jgi:hypothetical protein